MLKRKQPIVIFAILIVILVLELLPYGAVLHFGNPEGEPLRETFSYFDMTPYGYANFGPFITAILTCVLLVISIINLLVDNDKIKTTIKIVALIALVASLAPLIVNCYSVIGGVISLLLLLVLIISLKKEETV
jgi:prepilin signal peptidase PulO-like enzyme (type II secretory pathway)